MRGHLLEDAAWRRMLAALETVPLRQEKPTLSLKNRRKRAGWNTEYLADPVQQTA